MRNLLNFFFSFDKLMKEKIVVLFFWLAIIVFGMAFFADALAAIRLGPLAKVVAFVNWFATLLFALVAIRLLAELAVAIFRINDNLSPDGGKSELADIDPIQEARKAAEAAAHRARDLSKTAGEKAQAATKSARESVSDVADTVQAKAKDTSDAVRAKAAPKPAAAPVKKAAVKKAPTKAAAPKKATTSKKTAAKKPTTRKPAAKKATAKKTTAAKKRGPKKGVKVKRDAQGRLLKKDGTLRAKPGPKS